MSRIAFLVKENLKQNEFLSKIVTLAQVIQRIKIIPHINFADQQSWEHARISFMLLGTVNEAIRCADRPKTLL